MLIILASRKEAYLGMLLLEAKSRETTGWRWRPVVGQTSQPFLRSSVFSPFSLISFFFLYSLPFSFLVYVAPRRYGRGMELLVTGWESNLLFTVETGLLARGRTSRRCFNGGQESVRLPCCHYYCCSERKDLATTIAALRYWCYSKCWTEEKRLLLQLSSEENSSLFWSYMRLEPLGLRVLLLCCCW